MRWPFGKNHHKTTHPSHEEILEKTQSIIAGTDSSSKAVTKLTQKHIKDLQDIRDQAKIVVRQAKKVTRITDTAYQIAIATGGLRM